MPRNVIAVIDGAAGSCGKAKVVGELATDKDVNIGAAVTNCMPNAGHTFVSEKGDKYVFRNIPVSSVNPNVDLFIGPGSAIDMEIFIEEYESVKHLIGDRKIYVHELVPLIEPRHKVKERSEIKTGSTFKGCGEVSKDKIGRKPELNFFKGYKNAVVCSNDEWLDRLYSHLDNADEFIVLEGAQGCDLSLNFSGHYPNTTSRNVSTAQLLSDSGIPDSRVYGTLMVIRPFPIRISSITKDGEIINSGGYGTGEELTWSQINIALQKHSYPFHNDVASNYYNYDIKLPERLHMVKNMYGCLPDIYKIQLYNFFGNLNFECLELLPALEIERLYHKSLGESNYESIILEEGGYPYLIDDLSEQTTVTKMERRVFDLDIRKLKNNIRINDPYGLYLNFFEQLDQEYAGFSGSIKDTNFDMNTIERYLEWLEAETGKNILALGTGERNNERILVKSLIKR